MSNWLRIRNLPDIIHYYRNAELRSGEVMLSSPRVPYGDGFVTCEEHPIPSASKALLSDVLGVGWPELGIANIEMRKIFTRLANEGMELFLKSRGLHSFEMANGQLAWWFGGDTPDTRLAFNWGGVKGSRVLRGASEKRKVQMAFWRHFAVSYRPCPILSAAHATAVLGGWKNRTAGQTHAPDAAVVRQGLA